MTRKSDNEIRKGVSIVFADNKARTIYPISLRGLRKLMAIMKDMETEKTDEEGNPVELSLADQMSDDNIDLMVEAAALILSYVEPEIADDLGKVEELVDIRTFNELVAAAMGTDPKE